METGKLTRTLIGGLLGIAAILLVTTAVTQYNLDALFRTRQQALGAREILDSLTQFQQSIVDAESGQRGYLITGDETYLAPYTNATLKIGPQLDRLQRETEAESLPHGEVGKLRAATDEKLDELAKTIALRQRSGFTPAQAIVSSDAGKRTMDSIRATSDALIADEENILAQRRATSAQNYAFAKWSSLFAGLSGLAALAALWALTRRQLAFQRELTRALHAQKEQLRVTLASIGDAVITTDTDGGVTYLNSSAEGLTGWTLVDACGEPLEKVFHIVNETSRALVENPARRALREGVAVELANHTILIAKDGVEHAIDDSAAPIRNADQTIAGVVLTFHDISLRRRQERAVEAANEQVHLALEAGAIIGTWIWDIPGDRVTMDAPLANAFSIEPALAAKGISIDRYLNSIHPDDVQQVKVRIEEAIQSGEPFRIEYRLRPSNELIWVEASGRVSYNAKGEPVRFPGVIVDITERRQTERQLALAQKAGGIGTFEWNSRDDFLTVSEEYGRIWGLEARERISIEKLVAQVHPDDRHMLAHARTVMDDSILYAEFRIHRADTGELRWIARRGQAVDTNEDGGAVFAGVIYDITDRKNAEHALQQLNETLEQRVAERTQDLQAESAQRALAEDQLRQAQKMEAVGQLTGGIAHDFNNILTGISGSLEMITARSAQGRMQEVARHVAVASTLTGRAAALTHRLLAFSRRQSLAPEPFHVGALISGMQALLDQVVGPSVTVLVSVADDLWMTHCDPHQLENALLNLAINARDAMPESGYLTIACANSHCDDLPTRLLDGIVDGDCIVIKVTDTGAGMAPEIVERAFEPFFTTKPVGEGSGLGLSMVHGFVMQSGGSISISSEPGAGTTVTIAMPRYVDETLIADRDSAGSNSPAVPRRKIMVVDDEDAIRSLLTEYLQDDGYEVLQAATALPALKVIESRSDIELLITDMVLPGGMNGRQLAEAALAKRPNLKILLITGYPGTALIDLSLLEPNIEFLGKPFTLEQLAAKMRLQTAGSSQPSS